MACGCYVYIDKSQFTESYYILNSACQDEDTDPEILIFYFYRFMIWSQFSLFKVSEPISKQRVSFGTNNGKMVTMVTDGCKVYFFTLSS